MIVTYSIWLYPECEIVEAFKDRQPGSSSHLDELISLFSNVNTWFYLILLDSTRFYLIYCILYFICSLLRLGGTKYSITGSTPGSTRYTISELV